MSKNNRTYIYDVFYAEIPQALEIDPLSELSTELEDMSVAPTSDPTQGLSHEQVSQIARDSLGDAQAQEEAATDDHNLFSADSSSSDH
jgi:hypothetical protein